MTQPFLRQLLPFAKSNPSSIVNIAQFILVILVNPLYSLSIIGLFNIMKRSPYWIFFSWGVSFWLLFPNDAHLNPFDYSYFAADIPMYFKVIENLTSVPWTQAFSPMYMSGYEPIPQLVWFSLRYIGLSTEFIISLQLFVWIQVFILAAHVLSPRYSVLIAYVGLGLYPNVLTLEFFSFYRSSWAFTFLCLFFIAKNQALGIASLFASVLSHFLATPALLYKFGKRFLNPSFFLLSIFGIYLFFRSGLINGFMAKFLFYTAYDAGITASTLVSLAGTICLLFVLYLCCVKKDDSFNAAFFLLLLYCVLFVAPVLSIAASRFFLLVAPIAFMVLVSRQQRQILFTFSAFSFLRFYMHIADNNSVFSVLKHSVFSFSL